MTNRELEDIINARQSNGAQPVEITSELMNAAHERAHQERSEAIHYAIRWCRGKVRNLFHTAEIHETFSTRDIKQACLAAPTLVDRAS